MSTLVDPTHLIYSNRWQHALMRSDAGDWYLNAKYLTPDLDKISVHKQIPNPVWFHTDEILWRRKRWTVESILREPDFHWRYARYHPKFLGPRGALHTSLVTWLYLKDIYALDPAFVQHVFQRAMERQMGSQQGIDRGFFAKAMLSTQIRFVTRHYGRYWKVFWGVTNKLSKWMFFDLDIVTPAGISINGGYVSEPLARKLFPAYPRLELYCWMDRGMVSQMEGKQRDDVPTDEG
jgi:hypothetical protein